jgi:hypothetical protein
MYSISRAIHLVYERILVLMADCAAAITYPYSSYMVLSLPNMDSPGPLFLKNLTFAME